MGNLVPDLLFLVVFSGCPIDCPPKFRHRTYLVILRGRYGQPSDAQLHHEANA